MFRAYVPAMFISFKSGGCSIIVSVFSVTKERRRAAYLLYRTNGREYYTRVNGEKKKKMFLLLVTCWLFLS